MDAAHTLLAAYPLPGEVTRTATCESLPALPDVLRCKSRSDGNRPPSSSPQRPVSGGGASTNGDGDNATAAPLSPAPGARGLARALSRTDLASPPSSAGHARLGSRAAMPSASSASASIPEGCENTAIAAVTNGPRSGMSQSSGRSGQAERLHGAWSGRRSASGGSGDAVSLAHGMGSVEMLDAGYDAPTTPHASSSGGASPWGSAGKSSSSSLLSDATAFQVRSNEHTFCKARGLGELTLQGHLHSSHDLSPFTKSCQHSRATRVVLPGQWTLPD